MSEDEAHLYPEVKWLFIPVKTQTGISDIRQLLALRAETKRLKTLTD